MDGIVIVQRLAGLELEAHRARVARDLKARAGHWVFEGRLDFPAALRKLASCKYDCLSTGARILYTRDSGHHTSGWMRNPDFERCLHLSISPLQIALENQLAPMELRRAVPDLSEADVLAWVSAFLGDAERFAWLESAKSEMGKKHEVRHWRVFCDAGWRPLLPRGEVYSSGQTPPGWKSWSEVKGRLIVSTVDPS